MRSNCDNLCIINPLKLILKPINIYLLLLFQVFCNICTLPGHLPCVHQTNDFRQRKLVIETFGWLAFKDWFREPEFWSWWNCAGFTNVPLYKLMQHRPNVASPDLQEISES